MSSTTNTLKAVCHIIDTGCYSVTVSGKSTSRVNAQGDGLEAYVRDAYAGCLNTPVSSTLAYGDYFSWLGSQNHPPDLMLRCGEAIEVKKIGSPGSDIALNSSMPKREISSTSHLVTRACRESEDWSSKDMVYAIGCVKKNEVKSLWLVYGEVYAASHEYYQSAVDRIRDGIDSKVVTNELARINGVDPLGRTNLRVRGMWTIKHPRKCFDVEMMVSDREIVAIIPERIFDDLSSVDISHLDVLVSNQKATIRKIHFPDPDNPVKALPAYVITNL